MFTKKVVLVIGAGASYEYNMPLGSELARAISSSLDFKFQRGTMLSGDRDLLDHIRRHVGGTTEEVNEYLVAATMLARAIPSFVSVDEAIHFVSSFPKAVEIGKVAILHHILMAERECTLQIDRNTGRILQLPQIGWLPQFFSQLVARVRREEMAAAFNNVTFINFNYDRLIEQYLYWALQERTSLSAGDAEAIVANLNMLRPYGSIGQFDPDFGNEFGFGTTAFFDPFRRLSSLGTYTESKPLHDQAAAEGALRDAALVIFLGFGFHTSNLDLIKAPHSGDKYAFGTVKGIHRENHDPIKRTIYGNLGGLNHSSGLYDFTAEELLRELRPQIMMLVG
ncbi:hypothetical protein ACVI1L_004442 [Bradyrhizobium sp. USDA 4516]